MLQLFGLSIVPLEPNCPQNPFFARSLERLERQRHALEAEVEVK